MSSRRGITPESSTKDSDQKPRPERVIALCRHDPEGSPSHHDLFLGPETGPFGDEERVLESWRLPEDPRKLGSGEAMAIVAIGLHRGLYARLEAPRVLDRGRGRVIPVARGRVRVESGGAGMRVLGITWSDGVDEILALESVHGGGFRLHKRS